MPQASITSPSALTLAILKRMAEEWVTMPTSAQERFAQFVETYWKQVHKTFFDADWTTAATEFQRGVGADEELAAGLQELLAPAASIRAEIPPTQQEKQAILSALETFPAAGSSAKPLHEFDQPARALARVLEVLRLDWDDLDAQSRQQMAQLQEDLQARLALASSIPAREKAMSDFLATLEALTDVAPRIESTLNAYRRPYPKAIDDVRKRQDLWEISSFTAPSDSDEAVGELLDPELVLEQLVQLYTEVDFPAQVGQRAALVPLVVRLRPNAPEGSPLEAIREVLIQFGDPAKPEQLTVLLSAEGFRETTGDPSRTIMIFRDRPSQPAVFLLQPEASGEKRVVIDFYHKDRLVGSTDFTATVLEEEEVDSQQEVVLGGEPVVEGVPQNPPDPPDLELRVTLGADRRQLHYMLHSAVPEVGYHWTPAGSVSLEADPQNLLRSRFDRLSQMARRGLEGATPDEVQSYQRELERLGQNLYEQLFSDDLKQAYRRIRSLRNQGIIQELLITSDEPWIPWEMIRPYEYNEETGEEIDDPFLCDQFHISRWLAGRSVADAVRIETVQFVAHADNLAFVAEEQNYFTELPARPFDGATIMVKPAIETAAAVMEALEQATVQLYHFACHGNFNYDNPEESVLRLKDSALQPSQIVGRGQAGIRKSKPLVFLNACHSGRAGFKLSGLGGWAERFVNSGASAFVGSLWEVNDALAATFAQVFYDALWSGRTLGQAMAEARAATRGDSTNPTWLAYTLYGDPNCKWKWPDNP